MRYVVGDDILYRIADLMPGYGMGLNGRIGRRSTNEIERPKVSTVNQYDRTMYENKEYCGESRDADFGQWRL